MILLKISFRNIFANKRRSLLTLLMMITAFTLMSFVLGLMEGTYAQIIDGFIKQKTGVVQIHHKDYQEKKNFFKTIRNYGQLIKMNSSIEGVSGYSARIYGGGLGFANKKSFPISIQAFDLSKEINLSTIKNRIIQGRLPSTNSRKIAIGSKVSQIFNLSIGDELVIVSTGQDGSIANDIFIVEGVMGGPGAEIDDYMIYMSLSLAQEFFTMAGLVHEIAISSDNIELSYSIINSLSLPTNLLASPWEAVEEDFYHAMELDKSGGSYIIYIISIIVSLGILNTILMSVLERTREFGVMKAIGTRPSFIFYNILLEIFLLTTISVFVGIILSLGLLYYFSFEGISLPEPISYGGMILSGMKTDLSLKTIFLPVFVIYMSSFLVGLYPAIKALNIVPVDALRDY